MAEIVLISIPETTIRQIVEQAVKKALTETAQPATTTPPGADLLNRREAAALAGVCLATLDNKVREGVLKKYRTGGIVRFKRQEVIEAFSMSYTDKKEKARTRKTSGR